jgi:DNA-binding IclR family transcriptional regulator
MQDTVQLLLGPRPHEENPVARKKQTAASAAPQRRRRPHWAAEESLKSEDAIGSEDRYHSRTIERALDVLESFQPAEPALSLKDVSRRTGFPESTLFRILLTLQKRGYLEQRVDGTYQLTRKVLFGRLLDDAEALRALAAPQLQELASSFNETASLAYFFEEYIQVLDTVETFHEIRVSNRRGRILPPHCSAMGKAILAFQPAETVHRMLEAYGLTKRTEHSIVDRSALRAELERIQKEGFAVDREESMLGGICIGAPITSHSGHVIAALSVSTPVPRLPREREPLIQRGVVAAAKAVSVALAAAKR